LEEPDVQHHRKADDVGTGLEIPKRAVFGHAEKLNRQPALHNRASSDGVDGSTGTASQCAMLVLLRTNKEKEPSTMCITTLGFDLAKSVFNFTALTRMASWFCKRSCAVALF